MQKVEDNNIFVLNIGIYYFFDIFDFFFNLLFSAKKWGTTPPSIFNEFGSTFSSLVGRKNSDLVARPLPGGGVIIDKTTSTGELEDQQDTEELPDGKPSFRELRSRSTFNFAHSVDMEIIEPLQEKVSSESLTPEENEIDKVSHSLFFILFKIILNVNCSYSYS